ncbi:MAG: DUF1565 domain-containing protein, partial [Myxococcota bacterium]
MARTWVLGALLVWVGACGDEALPSSSAREGASFVDAGARVAPSATLASVVATTGLVRCLGGARLDFERDPAGRAILPGDRLEDRYRACGITLACFDPEGGDRPCIAFDSAAPTGGDDDVGTPHSDFGGPGVGVGGAAGGPGENDEAEGHVLVISEQDEDRDGDGRIDVPDDLGGGGEILVSFDEPVDLVAMTVLDVDRDERDGFVQLDTGRELALPRPLLNHGSNSRQVVPLREPPDVVEIRVRFAGSGAVAGLTFSCEGGGLFADLDGDGFGDPANPSRSCLPGPGFVDDASDCDDTDADVFPGALDEPDDGFEDANCDGLDGDAERLIFVAPDGSDSGAGTRASPYRTLPRAIARATVRGFDVAVHEGEYREDEALELDEGTAVFGGYTRDGTLWRRAAGHRALLEVDAGPSDGTEVIGVLAEDLDVETIFERVDVETRADGIAGRSSFGVVARRSPGLVLRHLEVRPGDGEDGEDGESGSIVPDFSRSGTAGTPLFLAGAGGTSSCGVAGGAGGAGIVCFAASAGESGDWVPPLGGPFGLGGNGGVGCVVDLSLPLPALVGTGGDDGRDGFDG